MIRKATKADIGSVLNITKLCAERMISNGIFQWNEHYPNRSAFENDLDRNELYVLTDQIQVLGCIVISTHMDEEYIPVTWLTPNQNNIYIHRLAVVPTAQGNGLAQQLMDFAEKLAKDSNNISVRLDTFSQNLRNQRFYQTRGYEQLGSIYFPKQSVYPFYCYELIL